MKNLLVALLSIAACAGSIQAATAARPPVTSPSATPVSTTAAGRPLPPRGLTDSAIEQAIRAKLAKSKIGADHFTVKVEHGVAYWDGKTEIIQHKGAATRMARTAGAVAVVNRIKISDAARQKAMDKLSGNVPHAQVKHPEPAAQASR